MNSIEQLIKEKLSDVLKEQKRKQAASLFHVVTEVTSSQTSLASRKQSKQAQIAAKQTRITAIQSKVSTSKDPQAMQDKLKMMKDKVNLDKEELNQLGEDEIQETESFQHPWHNMAIKHGYKKTDYEDDHGNQYHERHHYAHPNGHKVTLHSMGRRTDHYGTFMPKGRHPDANPNVFGNKSKMGEFLKDWNKPVKPVKYKPHSIL